MQNVNVELKLVNDYSDGKRNGEIKIISCLVKNKNSMTQIKNYIRDKLEINIDDMWKIENII